jgi:DNA helicase IV
LSDLYARPNWLATLTPDWSPERRALLWRARDAPLTVSDVALLDEAAELLGTVDATSDAERREAKQQRKRDIENAEQAIRNMDVEGMIDAKTLADGFEAAIDRGTTAERAANDREWAYGHIVVDEAQELSPMQWRMLMRRNPLKSFTIVGDVAQASAAAGATSWAEALQPHVGTDWRLEELTVNYRTPAQITEVAERMALAHGVDVTRSRAVREGDWPVTLVRTENLAADLIGVIAAERLLDSAATIAVIVSDSVAPAVLPQLVAQFGNDLGVGAAGLSKPVAVLRPSEAKGLEFDSVVVAEPQRIVDEIARGAAALYVAMTRPTQRLALVSEAPFPAGIDSPHP